MGTIRFSSITVDDLFDEESLDASINKRLGSLLTEDPVIFMKASHHANIQKSDVRTVPCNAGKLEKIRIMLGFNWIEGMGVEYVVNGRRQGACVNKTTGEFPVATQSRLSRYNLYQDYLKLTLNSELDYTSSKKSATAYQRNRQKFFNHRNFKDWIV